MASDTRARLVIPVDRLHCGRSPIRLSYHLHDKVTTHKALLRRLLEARVLWGRETGDKEQAFSVIRRRNSRGIWDRHRYHRLNTGPPDQTQLL